MTMKKNKTLINGKLVTIGSPTYKTHVVENSLRAMDQNLLGTTLSLGKSRERTSNMLYLLGCDFADEDINFSLLTEQTDEENIDNPNIFDEESFSKLKNKDLKPDKSFPNVDDPFYETDDCAPDFSKADRSRRTRNNRRNVDTNGIVANLADQMQKHSSGIGSEIANKNGNKRLKKNPSAQSKVGKVVRLRNGKYALRTAFKLTSK